MKETGTDGFELQCIKTEPLKADQVDFMKEKAGSYEALFSRRSMKFREWGLKDKSLTEDDYRRLILEEYTFLKRPVYVIEQDVFVGNTKATVEAIKARLSE